MEKDDDQKLTKHPDRKVDPSKASNETGEIGCEDDDPPAESFEEELPEDEHRFSDRDKGKTSFPNTDDSERAVLALARQYPGLSPQTAQECFLVLRSKQSAANKRRAEKTIICCMTKQIVNLAKAQHERNKGCEFLDLFQEGVAGALRAIKKFDMSVGVPFPIFARPHIRWAMSKYVREHGRSIKLPNRLVQELVQLGHALEQSRQANQEKPSIKQLAELMDCDEKKANQLLEQRYLNPVESLSHSPELGEEEPLVHSLLRNGVLDQPENQAERNEQLKYLMLGLDQLKPREQEAILLHHWDGHNLAEVGVRLGISAGRAREIVRAGMRRLQRFVLRSPIGIKGVSAPAVEAYLLTKKQSAPDPPK